MSSTPLPALDAAAPALAEALLDASPDCIKTLDLAGRLQAMNRPGRCLMEIDDFDAVAGRDWAAFWAAGGLEEAARAAVRAAATGDTARFSGYCPTARGTPKWWEVTVAPVSDAHGRVQALVSISRDVTLQHERALERERLLAATLQAGAEAERARGLLQAVIDGTPALIFAKTLQGAYFLGNRAWREHRGVAADRLPGITDADIVDAERAERFRDQDRLVLDADGPVMLDEQGEQAGRPVTLQWCKFALRDDQGRAFALCGVGMDVSARKAAEDELRQADGRKNEFLALLAHELRNPLAPIVNATHILARTEPLSDTGRRALAMIERQGRQMTRLIEDLLEISRITRGKIALQPRTVCLRELVDAAAEALQPTLQARTQTLRVEAPPAPVFLHADPVRLAQILENLLSNAAKYTHVGGRITLTLQASDTQVRLAVQDDGIGLAPEDLERVFGMFVQAQAGVGDYQGGLGIGLAMVRELVQMHGGRVWAESQGRGKGATFVVELPCVSSSPPKG